MWIVMDYWSKSYKQYYEHNSVIIYVYTNRKILMICIRYFQLFIYAFAYKSAQLIHIWAMCFSAILYFTDIFGTKEEGTNLI